MSVGTFEIICRALKVIDTSVFVKYLRPNENVLNFFCVKIFYMATEFYNFYRRIEVRHKNIL